MDWKRYYEEDFGSHEELIREVLEKYWGKKDDVPIGILDKGGFLSFPHTHIEYSIVPIIRCLNALFLSNKNKCLLIGVFHRISNDPLVSEFSLDNLERMIRFLEKRGVDLGIEFRRIFLPDSNGRPKTIEEALVYRNEKSKIISDIVDDDTAILITGDLIHYGSIYGNEEEIEGLEDNIERIINEDLEKMIIDRKIEQYLDIMETHLNDQATILLPLVHTYSTSLDHEIFSCELTDYSDVLSSYPPTYVASVFYGAYPVEK